MKVEVKLYTHTDENYQKLWELSQPQMYLIADGTEPPNPQIAVNEAWEKIGDEMGFQYMTARPADREGREFYAVPKVLN